MNTAQFHIENETKPQTVANPTRDFSELSALEIKELKRALAVMLLCG